MDKRRRGTAAEQLAARFLRARGYRILQMNYTCAAGEADIVAEADGALVFVEVKSRASADFGPPREQVGPAKRRRLSRVAELYAKQHRVSDRSIRFDIVEVELDERGAPHSASVVVGAFGDRRA